MRQYRPTIDELKKRYSREMAQRKMLAKRRAENPGLLNQPRIPDNSEPWLPHLPRSVEECAWTSQNVADTIATWRKTYPRIFSSES
jgi:hypothetical protein